MLCMGPPALLPFPISLSRQGYPRIIPAFIRLQMYRGDEKADLAFSFPESNVR